MFKYPTERQGKQKKQKEQTENNKVADESLNIPRITLHINGLFYLSKPKTGNSQNIQ